MASFPESTLPGITPSFIEVSYGGSVLLPSPFIQHSVEIERDDAGDREIIRTTRTLTGQILTSGIGYHFVRQKQRELESAFELDGLEFKIIATADNPCLVAGTPIESGVFPKVISLDVQEDVQYNRLDYTIVLEEATAPSGVSGVVSDSSNTWSYTENEDQCLIDIVHTASAQGLNTAISGLASNALDNAVLRVKSQLGLQNAPSGFPCYTEPASGSNVRFYEVTTSREESVDTEDATYSVTERFTLISGLLPFNDERTAQYQVDADNVTTISLQGTVRGMGRTNDGAPAGPSRSSGGTGFENAVSGFNNLVRPDWTSDALVVYDRYGGSGTLVIGNPQSTSVTQSPCNGTIGYSVVFTDDPAALLPSGIQDLACSVQRNDPVVANAIINVPFNALGPVFQRLCTTTEGSFAVQCAVTAINTGDEIVNTNRAIEVAEEQIIKLQPNPADFVELKLTGRNQTVDRINRSINVTYTWTFSQSIDTVPSDIAPIILGRIS
jgi:hypothetical protein